jgi:N,N'-diacetyllegionaminate synthase
MANSLLEKFKSEKRQCLYIAEIGLNHNGDFSTAKELVKSAAKAGADCVKFQTFIPEKMNSVYTSSLLKSDKEEKPDKSQVEFFREYLLTENEYRELKKLSHDLGLVFFSSPFDRESVDLLEGLNVPLYKVASSEVTNHRLLKRIAETGKPVILSTGMAGECDIAGALKILKGKNTDVVLLHCVSLYPLDLHAANLKRIQSLRETFNREAGFSDHTRGNEAAVIAASLGARIFEKHFSLGDSFECPDRDVSFDAERMSGYIESVERAVRIMGSGVIPFAGDEAVTARAARRSIFARKEIPEGKVIEDDDLVLLRPGMGIPASMIENIVGKKSCVTIKKDYMIREEYLV